MTDYGEQTKERATGNPNLSLHHRATSRLYPEGTMGETTGGAIIARMLKQEQVEKFFGIVDGTYTQLFAYSVELGSWVQPVAPS
jgi:hypothetical protein